MHVYFKRFDDAESLYLDMDNKEAAMDMRVLVGDWFKVVELITQKGAGDDRLLAHAHNSIGEHYAGRQKWAKALKFYQKSKNVSGQISCAYILDEFGVLEGLIDQLPDASEHLRDLGDKFQSVGLCTEATRCYLRLGDHKSAIDCCVLLNQWDAAVRLAEEHRFSQIDSLLSKYASHLLKKQRLFQAVDLYRKANYHTDAARLLDQLGRKVLKRRTGRGGGGGGG